MTNKVLLRGRLGADPELRYTGGGQAVTRLRVATTKHWTDRQTGDRQERTDWHTVVVFGRLAEVVGQYGATGRDVFIDGELNTRELRDQATGQSKPITEVKAFEVAFLDPNPHHQRPRQPGQGQRGHADDGPAPPPQAPPRGGNAGPPAQPVPPPAGNGTTRPGQGSGLVSHGGWDSADDLDDDIPF